MSLQDPVSDMLTRIRNAQQRKMAVVNIPFSNFKEAIAKVLKDEGYVETYYSEGEGAKKILVIELKYYEGVAVIDKLKRISRPGRRIYKKLNDLPQVLDGLGIAIISNSKGVMSDRAARKSGQGGEVICYVS